MLNAEVGIRDAPNSRTTVTCYFSLDVWGWANRVQLKIWRAKLSRPSQARAGRCAGLGNYSGRPPPLPIRELHTISTNNTSPLRSPNAPPEARRESVLVTKRHHEALIGRPARCKKLHSHLLTSCMWLATYSAYVDRGRPGDPKLRLARIEITTPCAKTHSLRRSIERGGLFGVMRPPILRQTRPFNIAIMSALGTPQPH